MKHTKEHTARIIAAMYQSDLPINQQALSDIGVLGNGIQTRET